MPPPRTFGPLKPWLAVAVAEEVDSALVMRKTDPNQRAEYTASQQLRYFVEDDGSNLRISAFRNEGDRALVQLVEFTQLEADAPVDAIVSDGEFSIKIRFSRHLWKDFEKRKCQNIEGGMIQMRDFEITIPRFNTSDEDQIHLLLKDAQLHGAYGSPTFGHPKSIVTSPKIRTLLRKFHGEASENSEDSDGDVSSQGEVTEASQSLFATQGPFSQLPILRNLATQRPSSQLHDLGNRNHGAAPKTPTIKSEPGQQTSAKGKGQPKPADNSRLLALLKQQRGGPMNETMLPSALPKIASQRADSASSQSKSQIPKTNLQEDVAEEEHEEEDAVVIHTEEDASGFTGLDEEINGTIDSGESKDPIEQPNPDKGDAPRDPKVSAEGQVSKGPADNNNNNTPTSYQIPVDSSSTVPTTNSSLPTVLPTVEKAHSTQASSKCERRFFQHPRWNCVLPATRSASKIPQDQEEILKKPSSIFPTPVGFHYPVANVPNHILMTLTARLEEQKQRLNPPENNSPYQGDQSAVVENAPSSPATADAVVDVISSPPTIHYTWSSSPVRTMKRQAYLPPDSSFPEEQDGEERDACPLTRGTESSHHPIADIPSSPPRTVTKAQSQEDPMDDDSDLETSVPMPLSHRKRSLQSPAGEVGDSGSRKNNPFDQMSRHVSSSGKPYTHLHLPEITRPLQVTTSSISGKTPPVTQPPQPPPHKDHHTASSAPVIPCSYEAEKTPRNTTQRVVTFDGAAESRMASFPDQEDAVERQIQNEQSSRLSQRRSLASPSLRNQHTPTSPAVRHRRASQNRNSSADGSPAHHRPKDPPIKREVQSPSPPHKPRKRAKKSGTNFHFSQDVPVSQEPLTSLHEMRRKFHSDGGYRAVTPNVPRQRRVSSSASDRAGSDAGISSTHSPNSPSSRVPVQVKKEPSEEDPQTTRESRQPSASAAQRPTSSGEGSSTAVAKAPTKVKTEVVEEDDWSPLSPMETGVIPRPASPDGMDIDVPAEAQPQVSRIGSSAAEAQQANAPENISHVKETLPQGHLNPQHVEAQDSPQAALGIPDSTPAPGDAVPSLAKEKAVPVTDPQRNAATDAPVNPPGDVDTIQPPLNADDVERTTSMPTGPSRENSDMTEPSSTFGQFSQVYPEYTGNRKHFENLCGQLEWLRSQDRGLHPFLWDDYIIRSRTDYRKYTEECGDEGIDPLPWHKYYGESIPMPKFSKGVMNSAMLEKFFVEQGRPLRPIIHSNISRMEHVPERSLPPTFSPPFNSAPGGKDNHRPKKLKRQNKRKNGNLQQGVVGSPLRHNANQMPAPWTSTPLPAAGPSSASNHAQTAATSTTAEPFPQNPPQPAPPAPATRPPPKPPAPTAHQLTVRGAQNNPRPPPTSASAARSALVASSARAVSAKPPPPRPATSRPQQTAAAGTGSAAKGLPTITNPNNKRKRDGDGSPPPPARPASSSSTMTTKATKEKRPNGMPAPPPPNHSTSGGGGGSGGGAKGNKPRKTMFTIYKERRKAENSKKSTPGGSRAGSVV